MHKNLQPNNDIYVIVQITQSFHEESMLQVKL